MDETDLLPVMDRLSGRRGALYTMSLSEALDENLVMQQMAATGQEFAYRYTGAGGGGGVISGSGW